MILGQRIQTFMNVRFFDWRDLPILHRYRHRGLFLDAATMLTRGQFLVPAGAMLAYFAPAIGIFTFLCENGDHSESPLLGQVTHPPGSPSARLSFLAPESALESFELPALLDYAALQIGERSSRRIGLLEQVVFFIGLEDRHFRRERRFLNDGRGRGNNPTVLDG